MDIHIAIWNILKMDIQLRPEIFLLGMMDIPLEKAYGTLLLYMTTATRLLLAQHWKNQALPTVEEWLVKLSELAGMAKLMAIIKEKTLIKFKKDWKPFIDFLHETEHSQIVTYGFDDQL